MLLKNSQHYDNKRRYYFLNNIKSNYKVFSFNIIGSKNWGLARNILKFYSILIFLKIVIYSHLVQQTKVYIEKLIP